MSKYAVLTAIGSDRPGLVDAVSKFILDSGGNIEDSRMAILGGEFAMLILVNGEAPAIEKILQGASAAGEAAGLSVVTKATRAPKEAAAEGTIPYKVDVYSMDHPGIVQKVSHFLAGRGINVRALDTRLSYAPITGLPLFSLHAAIDVPSSEKIAEVRGGLENIGAQENIDIEVKPAS